MLRRLSFTALSRPLCSALLALAFIGSSSLDTITLFAQSLHRRRGGYIFKGNPKSVSIILPLSESGIT